MPRPSGAEISPAAQEFGTETPEEEVEEILPDPTATMSDLPDVGADVGVA